LGLDAEMKKPDNVTIIAFEGPDKVGKQTQSELLDKHISKLGVTTPSLPLVNLLYEIPWKHGIAYEQIYDMLKKDDASRKAPAVEWPEVFQAIQTANRLDVQRDIYKKANASPANQFMILFDRWHASSFAYAEPFGIDRDLLMLFRSMVWTPDLTIVFEGDGFSREGEDDAYEESRTFQDTVRDGYRKWVEDFADSEHIMVVKVDGKSVEHVQKHVFACVNTITGLKPWTEHNV